MAIKDRYAGAKSLRADGTTEAAGAGTEYGGGAGSPQRLPSGVGKQLTVGELARVTRQAGASGDWDGQTEVRPADTARKNQLARDTNGYAGEVQYGEVQ